MTDEATPQISTAATPPKRKKKPLMVALTFLWLPLSFLVPYLLMNKIALTSYRVEERVITSPLARQIEDARSEAIVSGLIGFFAACAIFGLWRLDKRLHDNEKDFSDGRVVTILVALAFFVWVVWTCAGQIMMRAHYEINDVPPQLPGLDTPHY